MSGCEIGIQILFVLGSGKPANHDQRHVSKALNHRFCPLGFFDALQKSTSTSTITSTETIFGFDFSSKFSSPLRPTPEDDCNQGTTPASQVEHFGARSGLPTVGSSGTITRTTPPLRQTCAAPMERPRSFDELLFSDSPRCDVGMDRFADEIKRVVKRRL